MHSHTHVCTYTRTHARTYRDFQEGYAGNGTVVASLEGTWEPVEDS